MMRPGAARLCNLSAGRPGSGVRTSLGRRALSSASGQLPPLSLLEHRHLTSDGPHGLVNYDHAATIQEDLRARLLAWKSLPEAQRSEASPLRPQLLSFEATPTFTLGRRQDALTPAQAARLQAPLTTDLPHRRKVFSETFIPQVRNTNRGGLTTYHGPGQLVLWPVLDMHSPLYPRYSVLSYAAHLEATTQRLLASLFGIPTYTSRDDPGVWVRRAGAGAGAGAPERKIAALGVHHRRHVTALGIAINIDVPVEGGEERNAWARFVPCGLEGKLVTSVVAEGGDMGGWDMGLLAARWASLFEEGLRDEARRGVDGEVDLSFRRAV